MYQKKIKKNWLSFLPILIYIPLLVLWFSIYILLSCLYLSSDAEPSICGITVSITVTPDLLGASSSISYTFSGSVLIRSKVLIISSFNSFGVTFLLSYPNNFNNLVEIIPKYLLVSNTWSGAKALITSHIILSLRIIFLV